MLAKEGINQNLYYCWSKDFLGAGKKRLAGDAVREATSDEVKDPRTEARQLKEALAEVTEVLCLHPELCSLGNIAKHFGSSLYGPKRFTTCGNGPVDGLAYRLGD